jgi:hypothetical protein
MVAALARGGAAPWTSPLAHDLRAIGAWSSNLAANRVLRALGGDGAAAEAVFARVGAASSTFTGPYIAGTALQPAMPADPATRRVPAASRRVTTARDLARVLWAVHAAATGDRAARARTGLTTRAARVLLGHLLASDGRGENRSPFAGGVPRGAVLAAKNGWVRRTRLGAALVYRPSGPPVIVVAAAHAEGGVGRAWMGALGARTARAAPR